MEVDSRETSEHEFGSCHRGAEEKKRSGTLERRKQEMRSSIDEQVTEKGSMLSGVPNALNRAVPGRTRGGKPVNGGVI